MLWAPMVLVIASFAWALPLITSHSQAFSPVDEWVYYDYLAKIPEQGIVRQGEPLSEESLRLMSCTGVQVYGPMGSRCHASQLDPSKYPFKGITTADAYTPLYFWTTWVGAKATNALGVESMLVAARLTSAIWLAVTMVLFYALLRTVRANNVLIVGLGLCFIGSPAAFWTYSFVSTDAPSLAFGCAILLAARLQVLRRISPWWLIALSVLGTLFKVTNILAVLCAAAYLLVYWILGVEKDSRWSVLRQPRSWRHTGDWRLARTALYATGASIVAQGMWLLVRRLLAVGPIAPQDFDGSFGIDALGHQLINFINGTLVSNVLIVGQSDLGYPLPDYLGRPLTWIALIGVFGILFTKAPLHGARDYDALRWSIAPSAVLLAPLLATALFLTQGFFFHFPSRYGLALAASFLLMFAMLLREKRYVNWLVLLYGLALVVWGLRYSTLPTSV